jgi:hypothetical protein
MKKIEGLQKDVPGAIKGDFLFRRSKTEANARVGRNLRKFIILTSLAGIGLFFNGCMGGYIITEPAYTVVSVRPPQPSNVHIWIDGDWAWNYQTHAYVQKTGYWERPRQGQTYVSGHWQSSPRGKYWVTGRWQRQGRQMGHGRG